MSSLGYHSSPPRHRLLTTASPLHCLDCCSFPSCCDIALHTLVTAPFHLLRSLHDAFSFQGVCPVPRFICPFDLSSTSPVPILVGAASTPPSSSLTVDYVPPLSLCPLGTFCLHRLTPGHSTSLQWCIYPSLKGILPLRNPLPSVPPQIWFEAITTIISFLVLIRSCGSFRELRSPASLAPVRPTTAFLAGHVHSRHLQSRIANAPPGGLSGLTHYLEL